MTAKAKTAYTAEQTVELVAAYVANPTEATVEAFAVKFGKTVKSVVAKLSREKVYVAKTYTNKNGEKPVKKDELADEFMRIFGLTEAEADSLTKANKSALAKVLTAFKVAADESDVISMEPAENAFDPPEFAEAVADVVGMAADEAGDMVTE